MKNKDKKKLRIRDEEPPGRWHDTLRAETKKSVAAIGFFILTILSLLSYWERAGVAGNYVFGILDILFGRG